MVVAADPPFLHPDTPMEDFREKKFERNLEKNLRKITWNTGTNPRSKPRRMKISRKEFQKYCMKGENLVRNSGIYSSENIGTNSKGNPKEILKEFHKLREASKWEFLEKFREEFLV